MKTTFRGFMTILIDGQPYLVPQYEYEEEQSDRDRKCIRALYLFHKMGR